MMKELILKVSCRLSMYFGRRVFSYSFVSFGIWRNVWGCARDWNKSSRKGRKGKKKVAEYIRTYVACIELCVSSWQSQTVSRSQNGREWGRERECCLWKSKCKRVRERERVLSLEVKMEERVSYCKSWVYMANPCHVIGSKRAR